MRSILAVDDSPSMRKMVSFTLAGAGFRVVEAVDGVDALERPSSNKSTWSWPTRTCRGWTVSA
jgi:two-component system chemotaxis response regulator CheY